VLKKAARYAQFANAAYRVATEVSLFGQSRLLFGGDIAGRIFGLKAEDVVYVHTSDGGPASPSFFIADDRDTNTNAIVVAIRGTKSAADVMTDLACTATEFLDGQAHSGMAASSKNLLKVLQDLTDPEGEAGPILRDLIVKHPTKKLVFVGHSLGAGVAVLTTLRLLKEPDIIQGISEVQCFAFAPPPVFGPPDKLPAGASSRIYSFVNHVDGIPRATPLALATLMKAVTHVDSLPLSCEECFKTLSGMGTSSTFTEFPDEPPEPLETSVREHLTSSFGNLSVVGETLLLYEDEKFQRRCDTVTANEDGKCQYRCEPVRTEKCQRRCDTVTP
jgi:hypothetical protein